MIGHIESYDKDIQTGVIKVEDKFFEFHIDNWTSEELPTAGSDVDFLEEDGKVLEVGFIGAYLKNMQPVKSRKIAGVLGLLGGIVGAHRMYLGYYGIAALQITVTLLSGGFGVVWGFIEGILLFAGHIDKDAKGRLLK